MPSHVARAVAVPFVQDGARHWVAVSNVHWAVTVPLHVPLQMEPSPAHAVRDPCGVPVTGEHAPTLPLTSHASHWPEQSLSQHTPSTQKFERHWWLAVHLSPGLSFPVHWVPVQ